MFFLGLESFYVLTYFLFSFLFTFFSFSSIFSWFYFLILFSFYFLPERNKTFSFIFTFPPAGHHYLCLYFFAATFSLFLSIICIYNEINQSFSSLLNLFVKPNKEGLSSFGIMSEYWSTYRDLKSLHERTCWTVDKRQENVA